MESFIKAKLSWHDTALSLVYLISGECLQKANKLNFYGIYNVLLELLYFNVKSLTKSNK